MDDPAPEGFLYTAPMMSRARQSRRSSLLTTGMLGGMLGLLFSLSGCGLKGPLYLPDGQREAVPAAGTEGARPVLEGSKVRTLPPAPQAQKKERERTNSSPEQQSQPTPVSPPDPDRPATTPPPPGQ